MLILIAGVLVGLAAVIPLGPMSMTIIGVATQQGRLAGAHAAAGVVAGDMASAGAAVGLALVGARLPGGLFASLQVAAIAVMVVVGLMLIVRTERLSAMADNLERPGAVLFTLTALSPITIGSWLAILLASPFMTNVGHLAIFVAGIIVASGIWHPALALGAASVGPRLSQPILMRLAKAGGLSMIALALVMVALGR